MKSQFITMIAFGVAAFLGTWASTNFALASLGGAAAAGVGAAVAGVIGMHFFQKRTDDES